jgi:hypothetical protein
MAKSPTAISAARRGIGILGIRLDEAGNAESQPTAIDPEENFGFVYLIRTGRHFKIGRTNAVGRRNGSSPSNFLKGRPLCTRFGPMTRPVSSRIGTDVLRRGTKTANGSS